MAMPNLSDTKHNTMKILALDPSVMNRCGYATLVLEWEKPDSVPLAKRGALLKEEWDFGFFEINGLNFQMRCGDLRDHLTRLQFEFDILVCEWPAFYSGNKGAIAAQQGYTINLAGIAMYIAGWFQVRHVNLFLYTAPDWKGTVKKAVTARRFFRMFNIHEMTVDHNAIDACMMLVYHCKKKGLC